jgi:hypothetical protein
MTSNETLATPAPVADVVIELGLSAMQVRR